MRWYQLSKDLQGGREGPMTSLGTELQTKGLGSGKITKAGASMVC